MPHPRGSWWQQLGTEESSQGRGGLQRDLVASSQRLRVLPCSRPSTARAGLSPHGTESGTHQAPWDTVPPHPEPCWGWAPSCVLCKAGTSTAELDQDPAPIPVPSTHPCPQHPPLSPAPIPVPLSPYPSGPCLSPPAPAAPGPVLPRAFDELFMRQVTSFVQIDFPPCHSNSIVLLEPHVRCCPVGTGRGMREKLFASPGIISLNNNNILNYISTFSVSIVIIKIKILKYYYYYHCCYHHHCWYHYYHY